MVVGRLRFVVYYRNLPCYNDGLFEMGPELSKFDFEKWAFLRQVESSMKTGERKKGTHAHFKHIA